VRILDSIVGELLSGSMNKVDAVTDLFTMRVQNGAAIAGVAVDLDPTSTAGGNGRYAWLCR
jgi:hypothetical protein